MNRVLWPDLYRTILRTALAGERRHSREGMTKDAGPYSIVAGSPAFALLPERGGSLEFANTEQLCYLGGVESWPLLKHAPSYERFAIKTDGVAPSGWGWPGAYGPRLKDSLRYAVALLHRNPDTRQAVVPIYNEQDLARTGVPTYGLDIPCTLNIVFWRTEKQVHCHAMMRSSDAWFGVYYDLPAFYFLQCRVAEALRLKTGALYFTTTSLHLYSKHWTKAQKVVTTPWQLATLQLLKPQTPMLGTQAALYSADPVTRMEAMQDIAKAHVATVEVTQDA